MYPFTHNQRFIFDHSVRHEVSFRFCLLLFVFLLLFAGKVLAQDKAVRGRVVAQSSKENVVLASVSWKNSGTGRVTDSAGYFRIPRVAGHDSLIISHVGFSSVILPIGPADSGVLTVELPQKETAGIVVQAKYNKGLFWWKRVVAHKNINDPCRHDTWSFDQYRKLELDLENVTRDGLSKMRLLRPLAFIGDNIDSTTCDRPFLPVFLSESISKCYSGTHPSKKREEVTAVKTSGVRNEAVLRVIDGLGPRINVYDDYVTLCGKEFVSPLSSAGNDWYLYRGADTQNIGNERYLHLFFSPRRKGANTFAGDCWIHAATWAIRQISLEVSLPADINFINRLTIRQEFIRNQDSMWVPAADRLEAGISPLKKDKLSLIARQTRLYQHVQLDAPRIVAVLAQNKETDQVVVSADAGLRPAEFWESQRPEALCQRERNVYRMVDTLNSIPLFHTYVRTVSFIVDGRKQLGKIEIGPWYKWISANQHEKGRLRFDVATTPQFSQQVRIHGYLAYGFGDKALKGEMDLRYRFGPREKPFTLEASKIHDLDNGNPRRQSDGASLDNMFSQMIRRPGIRQKFILIDGIQAAIGKSWTSAFSTRVLVSRSGYETFNPLPPKKMISPNQKDIINTELGIGLRFNPGEKQISSFRKDILVEGYHPVLELEATVGTPGVLGGMYRYCRIKGSLTQRVDLHTWGTVDYQVYGGSIRGSTLPFMLLEMHPGNEVYYYSRQAFNLMNRFEYVSDQFAGFRVEHDLGKRLLNLVPLMRGVPLRQFWNVKAVWGDLSPANKRLNCREYGNYQMHCLGGKPYIEVGTGLDDIFSFFRLDLVWRLAPSPSANIRPYSGLHRPPPGRFGIFGSFHLEF